MSLHVTVLEEANRKGMAQVDNMRGTAWGLLAATGITVVLSLTKEVGTDRQCVQ